ncbi:MAG: hypothetical protein KDA24_23695 [Deltaproteobacteria bacterium]|nr:hypothetical protein [Deltaproteobacteria bacterium]
MSDPARPASRIPLMLLVALLAALFAALPATFIDPPGNDLLLHGHMTEGAADALGEHGWAAFQDPWLDGPNWGYPLLHSYPHLAHQAAAVVAMAGIEPYQAMALLMAAMALLIPLGCFVGGRWLGLTRERAALGALVAATLRSADIYGHTPLSYSFEGAGLAPQALGGVLAALAIPALVAAAHPPEGSTLAGWARWRRLALAATLMSLVVRAHLVAGWVVPLVAGVLVVGGALLARRSEMGGGSLLPSLGRRLGWLALAGVGAAVLAAGFLIPFASDLSAVNDSAMEAGGRSYGLLDVLKGVLGGRFLDGGRPGVWTAALALGLMGLVRASSPVARPLAVSLFALVLLMAGRATWGDWMNELPLLGRFHDQRYLLGIHLVVPWLIATTAPEGVTWLRARIGGAARLAPMASLAALAAATALAMIGGAKQLTIARQAGSDLQSWRPSIEGVEAAGADLSAGGSILATFPNELVASTTAMSWLQRQGVATVGRPMHHYSHGFEMGWWFTRNPESASAEGAAALGLAGLLHRNEEGYRLQGVGSSFPDASLVRADLLMESPGASLDGLSLAWWQSGAWRVAQHPAVALGARQESGDFARRGFIESPAPSLLAGLPDGSRMGAVLDGGAPIRGMGSRTLRVRADHSDAWLKVAMSWHPRLQATVDGEVVPTSLLLPGHVGVRVPTGEHEVVLRWRPAPWRGPWAALNVLLVAGLLGVTWRARRPGDGT